MIFSQFQSTFSGYFSCLLSNLLWDLNLMLFHSGVIFTSYSPQWLNRGDPATVIDVIFPVVSHSVSWQDLEEGCAKVPSGQNSWGRVPSFPRTSARGHVGQATSRHVPSCPRQDIFQCNQPINWEMQSSFPHLPQYSSLTFFNIMVKLLTTEKTYLGIAIDVSCGQFQLWSVCSAVLFLLEGGHSMAGATAWGLPGCSQVTVAWAPFPALVAGGRLQSPVL